MDGGAEASFIHYAIQKLRWSPSQLDEWFEAEQSVKAFYYASTEIKSKHDKEEVSKIKSSGRRRR